MSYHPPMQVLPTRAMPGQRNGQTFLTIEAYLPEYDRAPISNFRGMNVGVGGKYTTCTIAAGEPVRRATLAELRIKDRQVIARFRETYPNAVIRVQRSRH